MANQARIEDLTEKIAKTSAELENLGAATQGTGVLTAEMFDKMKKAGLPVEEFMKAFEQFVGENFANSAEAMTRTLQGAIDRAKNFAKTILGWDVLKPVMDTLGGKLADFLDVLTKPDNQARIQEAAGNVAKSIQGILDKILELTPDAQTFVDAIVEGLQGLADWLTRNEGTITETITNIATTIGDVMEEIGKFIDMMFVQKDEEGTTRWDRLAEAIGHVVTAILDLLGLDSFEEIDWEGMVRS